MSHLQLSVEDFGRGKGTGEGLHLSTYDVPRSGEAVFDPKTETLTISFRYIDDEPAVERVIGPDASVSVGKHSGKLLRISIRLSVAQRSEIPPRVVQAFERLNEALEARMAEPQRYNERQNYAGVKQILDRNRTAVAASTTAAAAY
jgi:hypothetical protein